MFFGPLFMIALLALAIVLIVALVRWFSGVPVRCHATAAARRDRYLMSVSPRVKSIATTTTHAAKRFCRRAGPPALAPLLLQCEN